MSFNNRTGIASLIRILLFSCRQNFPFFLPVYKIPCTCLLYTSDAADD